MASPKELSKRTKLRPDQLERVKGAAGEGEASKYDNQGKQSLELTKRLAKARKKARRFILYSDQLGRRIYVADTDKLNLKSYETPLTFERKEALQFFEGFDDPTRKESFYTELFAIKNPELNGVPWMPTLIFKSILV